MTNTEEIKQKLGGTTQQVENKAKEFWTSYSPHYTNLEPWQRGTLLIALTLFLLFSVFYLTQRKNPKPRELTDPEKKEIERLAEERILRRTEFLRKLQP
jgi:hypothetical protein